MDPRTRRPRGGLPDRAIGPLPLSALHPLTRRQAQVLTWMAEGKRNGEIATILKLSERTVEKHAQKLFEKLGVETRGAASKWWHEKLLAFKLASLRNNR